MTIWGENFDRCPIAITQATSTLDLLHRRDSQSFQELQDFPDPSPSGYWRTWIGYEACDAPVAKPIGEAIEFFEALGYQYIS
jgi:hypothetical protein